MEDADGDQQQDQQPQQQQQQQLQQQQSQDQGKPKPAQLQLPDKNKANGDKPNEPVTPGGPGHRRGHLFPAARSGEFSTRRPSDDEEEEEQQQQQQQKQQQQTKQRRASRKRKSKLGKQTDDGDDEEQQERVWAPYVRAMPEQVTLPIAFNDDELAELQASPLRPYATRARDLLRQQYDAIVGNASDVLFPAMFGEREDGHFEVEDLARARSWVQSRLFMVSVFDAQGEWHKTFSLVPVADMINTASRRADVNVECNSERTGRLFECTTLRDIAAGEQLFVAYGTRPKQTEHSNGQLLMNYGFTFEHNPVLETVSVRMPHLTTFLGGTGDEYRSARMFASANLRTLGLLDGQPYVLHRRFPAELFAHLRILMATRVLHNRYGGNRAFERAELLQQFPSTFWSSQPEWYLTDTPSDSTKKNADGNDRIEDKLDVLVERLATDELLRMLRGRIEAYDTTVQEDEALLNDGGLSINRLNCVRVRLGEKRVLQRWMTPLDEYVRRSQPATKDRSNNKKTKPKRRPHNEL
eukprot:TRINITY_DN66223_c8_g10_i1.p1 TRINITY_DN66223_c8_g10~~TRINITY_DN66223_c8_g10_i1.p1  ORF type:complete len:598 (-),score=326.91 TRINITY_DN66223_c8_g10_i1:582-2156(-)